MVRRESLNVDSAGIGYYFGRHLSDLGYPVNLVNIGEARAFPPSSPRERFEMREVTGLTDELTLSQLASIRYQHNPRGQVVTESKEEARKRGESRPTGPKRSCWRKRA